MDMLNQGQKQEQLNDSDFWINYYTREKVKTENTHSQRIISTSLEPIKSVADSPTFQNQRRKLIFSSPYKNSDKQIVFMQKLNTFSKENESHIPHKIKEYNQMSQSSQIFYKAPTSQSSQIIYRPPQIKQSPIFNTISEVQRNESFSSVPRVQRTQNSRGDSFNMTIFNNDHILLKSGILPLKSQTNEMESMKTLFQKNGLTPNLLSQSYFTSKAPNENYVLPESSTSLQPYAKRDHIKKKNLSLAQKTLYNQSHSNQQSPLSQTNQTTISFSYNETNISPIDIKQQLIMKKKKNENNSQIYTSLPQSSSSHGKTFTNNGGPFFNSGSTRNIVVFSGINSGSINNSINNRADFNGKSEAQRISSSLRGSCNLLRDKAEILKPSNNYSLSQKPKKDQTKQSIQPFQEVNCIPKKIAKEISQQISCTNDSNMLIKFINLKMPNNISSMYKICNRNLLNGVTKTSPSLLNFSHLSLKTQK